MNTSPCNNQLCVYATTKQPIPRGHKINDHYTVLNQWHFSIVSEFHTIYSFVICIVQASILQNADMPSDPHLEGQTRILTSQPAFSCWKFELALMEWPAL